MIKILFIGQFPPPEGGVTILVKCLYDELKLRSDIQLDFIDIAQPRQRFNNVYWPKFVDNVIAVLIFCFQILIKTKRVDLISLHVSTDKLYLYGIISLFAAYLFNKKIIVRKFGGTDYNIYGFLKKSITKFVLKKSDVYLCETKQLIQIAIKDKIKNVYWFPNHRKLPDIGHIPFRNNCLKGVFLGLVTEEKGILDLCKAAELSKCLHIDIFGSLGSDINLDFFKKYSFCSYKGVLAQSDVFTILKDYDVLILPSYREGYPGVIIEAIASGLPVIVSNLPNIIEMLDGKAGIFVEPGNICDLTEAIKNIHYDVKLYRDLQLEAKCQSYFFSSVYWSDFFIKISNDLIFPGYD